MEDRQMRRAGLDYHEYADVRRHANWQQFLDQMQPDRDRCFALTTKGTGNVFDVRFQAADWLFFGSETAGLPEPIREWFAPSNRLRLPMRPQQRSLNLSNSVAITVYEAWRQHRFA
jgi:tRNA (cytidine/uridine-2'-O-)-methyltransferase